MGESGPESARVEATRVARPGVLTSKGWGAVLLVAYAVAVLLPVAVYFLMGDSDDPMLGRVGSAAGIAGLGILIMQAILASRFPLFERPFGYDRVLMFHKTMALVALVLLAMHPVMIAAANGYWALLGLQTHWTVWLGKGALILLVAVILGPAIHGVLGMDYQLWRVLHKGAIGVALLGAAHGYFMTDWDGADGVIRVWLGALLVAAVCVFVWRNVMLPFVGRRKLTLSGVRAETHDTWTLDLAPTGGAPIAQMPGQFLFLKITRKGRRSEEHPFTIASGPGGATIEHTIKESGGFTRTIGETREGDVAKVEGPLGRFSYFVHDPERIVFIAGGVGITPVMSMLRHLRDSGDARPVRLIYGNKTEEDIVFREELDAMPESVVVTHVLSRAGEGWEGEKGFVDADCIGRHVDAEFLAGSHVYLCGPPVMMKKVVGALRGMGVARGRIHYERFGL